MESDSLALPKTQKIEISDAERLKKITRHAGEFIANFEIAERKMDQWEQRLLEQEAHFQQQLSAFQDSIEELQNIMTEVGAARWRLAAEQALSIGEDHVKTLKELSEEQLQLQKERNEHFMRLAKKTFERLDRSSEHAIKQIKETIALFNPTEMRQVAEKNREILESTSHHAISNINKLHQKFHWKSLVFATIITLVASTSFGFYVEDEFPWESHKQVKLERNAGQALINVWPRLSDATKEQFLQKTQEGFG